MSFYGSSFSFDGVSCEEFGLMLYDFNNTTQGNSKFASLDTLEDRVYQRPRSLLYGTTYKNPLEFRLIFGVNENRAAAGRDIDREEMAIVSSWLMGHQSYRWLTVDQPDMINMRYRCVITDLEMIEIGFSKWAYSCTVRCDSPYAYLYPQKFTFTVDGISTVQICSRSTANDVYYPHVEITLDDCANLTITNTSIGRTFSLKNLPNTSDVITLNGETGVLSSQSGTSIYPYCNFHWPCLTRGYNNLTITGNGTFVFTCEFPVNIGG